MKRALARIALVVPLAAASLAPAATLYKLVDAQGRVSYVAEPPKGFDGKATPIEVASGTEQGVRFGPAKEEEAATNAEAKADDYLAQRRARWSAVEKRLKDAHAWLDEARENVANAVPGEGDVIRVAKQTAADNAGTSPKSYESPMVNGDTQMCSTVIRNGRRVQACARRAVSEDYAKRLEYLEDQVRQAELAVADAEIAYRRNMD